MIFVKLNWLHFNTTYNVTFWDVKRIARRRGIYESREQCDPHFSSSFFCGEIAPDAGNCTCNWQHHQSAVRFDNTVCKTVVNCLQRYLYEMALLIKLLPEPTESTVITCHSERLFIVPSKVLQFWPKNCFNFCFILAPSQVLFSVVFGSAVHNSKGRFSVSIFFCFSFRAETDIT